MSSALGRPSPVAIGFFLVFIAVTFAITWWAARRTRTTTRFYAAVTASAGSRTGSPLRATT
jgi:cation/acetate symporter